MLRPRASHRLRRLRSHSSFWPARKNVKSLGQSSCLSAASILPDAELRCLGLFGQERYLTAKGIAHKMNVVKSRVSKIIEGLIKKKLIQSIKDPEDSRVSLLSLTPIGQKKINEINDFMKDIHGQVLSQMAPDQRQAMLTNLDILKASMEAVKDMMV